MVTKDRRGRKPTGRTTVAVATRISIEDYEKVKKRAEAAGRSISQWLSLEIHRQVAWRPGEGTRRKMRKEGGP